MNERYEDGLEALNMGLEWAESEDPMIAARGEEFIEHGVKEMALAKAEGILAKPLGENNAP